MGIGDVAERLEQGSLIEELFTDGINLNYSLLSGGGPPTGWVRIKRWGCDPDVVPSEERLQAVSGGSMTVKPFKWEPNNVHSIYDESDPFDIIICTDCVYEPSFGQTWQELADCLEKLCSSKTQIFLACQRRYNDGVDRFLDRLEDGPFIINTMKSSAVVGKKVCMRHVRKEARPEYFYNTMENIAVDVIEEAEEEAAAAAAEAKAKGKGRKPMRK